LHFNNIPIMGKIPLDEIPRVILDVNINFKNVDTIGAPIAALIAAFILGGLATLAFIYWVKKK
jgi:hypothetical protein